MFREVVHRVCTQEFGHTVVGEANDGEEAVRLVASHTPDVLLLDLDLPRLNGFAVASAVKRVSRGTTIIAVTSWRGSYTLFRIERAGFDGYVDKGANSLGSLRQAIQAARHGQRYYSPTFFAAKEARLRDPRAFDKVLSDRELEILPLIGRAMSDEEIGDYLGICARTVETFRHRILKKLGLHGTPKLMRFAMEMGFTQMPLPSEDTGSARPLQRAI